MYTVSKIAVNSYNADGSACYEYDKKYKTWAELTTDIHSKDKYACVVFTGKGAHIHKGDKLIGNITDFYHHEEPINRVTLSAFMAKNESW